MQMKGTMGDLFPYRSTPHAFSMILKTEGIRGFYKGMLPNLLKVAPSVAIAFVTYEFVKARLFGVPMVWRVISNSTPTLYNLNHQCYIFITLFILFFFGQKLFAKKFITL